jgi:hypothetical protein
VNACVHTYTKPRTSSTRSRGLGRRIHGRVLLITVRAAPWGPWLHRGVPGRLRLHASGWRSSGWCRSVQMRHHQMESRICARGDDCHHVIAVGRAARATAERTTSSRNVILAVRHVAAVASKTREVDAGTTAGEGKSTPGAVITRWASPSSRSEQIRGAVSVHQDSLIH